MSSVMAKLIKRLESPIVTVRVGQGSGAKDFRVPEDVLCACSTWFTNALKADRFMEGQAKLIRLPEDSVPVFEAFVAFAYEGHLSFSMHLLTPAARDESFRYTLDIWNFGEKYMLPYLQDAALTSGCIFLNDNYLAFDMLAGCFESAATETSPFRTIIADYAVHRMSNEGESAGIEVERHLAGCEGFLRSFHASQKASSSLPRREFPRYRRPTRAGTSLYKTESEDVKWRAGEDCVFVQPSNWDTSFRIDCGGCGLYQSSRFEGRAQCRSCEEVAYCHCEESQWYIACDDCDGLAK